MLSATALRLLNVVCSTLLSGGDDVLSSELAASSTDNSSATIYTLLSMAARRKTRNICRDIVRIAQFDAPAKPYTAAGFEVVYSFA